MRRETIAYGSHPEQVADLWLPAPPGGSRPYPVVVSIHGGYFQEQYRRDLHDPLAARLAESGVAVLNVEYRRSGAGGSLEETTGDVMAAIDWLGEHPHGLRRSVAVVGHSAGGYLALWAASHPAVDLVVGLAAASDLADCVEGRYDSGSVAAWLGATPVQDPGRYAAADLVRRLPTRAKSWLVHGVDDRTVPPHQSTRYVELARASGDESILIPLAGQGHFGVIDPNDPAFAAWHDPLIEELEP